MGARSIRSDENVSEDHAREFDYVIKSLLSFFSRFWGSFSLFFFVSLSLFCVARARAVSLFLFFFRRRQRTRVEKKISAMLWTMMMKIPRVL